MIKSKNLLIKQGCVYGVKNQSKMTDVGVRLNVEMNLRNTQKNKKQRRNIVADAKLNNFDPSARLAIKQFEDWQMRVFAKNAKKGWRFFQPDAFDKPTPRSSYEAFGEQYKRDGSDKYEIRNQKIMACIFAVVLLLLATL
jgi:hypothetical protein